MIFFRALVPTALLMCASAFAAQADVSLNTVRALGAQVAHHDALFEGPGTLSARDRSELERRLLAASIADSDPVVRRKLMAIAARMRKLERDVDHRSPAGPVPMSRSSVEITVVAPGHGDSCANALGLTAEHPVRLPLATSGQAWFVVAAQGEAKLRFQTTSAGPDPALEVFDTCAVGAAALAANDDSFGLDADVATSATKTQNLYVHLKNAGEAGVVLLAAAAAPSDVSGTLIDGATGFPVSNAYVELTTDGGGYGASGYTDQSGAYTITPYQPGTYYVVAHAYGYVTQLYPASYCAFWLFSLPTDCDFAHASALTVGDTASLTNINFVLGKGRAISGQVRASDNTPLYSATVSLVRTDGPPGVQAYTDGAGHFTVATLPSGSYRMEASADGYGSQLFDHVPCTGPSMIQCDVSAANIVAVGAQDVVGINFNLPRLSVFTGKVTGNDGKPVPQTFLGVLDQNGLRVANGYADSDGNYTVGSLGIGTYYIYAESVSAFAQLYPQHDCAALCDAEISFGTPFTITSAGQTAHADFVLDYRPSLAGHITDAATGSPLEGVQIFVNADPPSSGSYGQSTFTDSLGNYSLSHLQAGQFFIWAQSDDHVDQIYSGVACESTGVFTRTNCDVSGATLLTVAPGQESVPSFDFALQPSGGIRGYAGVRAEVGSHIPAAVTVTVYDRTGTSIGVANSDVHGKYAVTDLAPGTYYAVATPNYGGYYINQIWQGIDCLNCIPTTGTPIVLGTAVTASSVDFQMTRLDVVTGRIVDEHGAPIHGAVVDLFSASDKSYVAGAGSDENGYYLVPGTLGTSYYVATEAGGPYIDQVYAGISCSAGNAYNKQCPLTAGTIVNFSASATQPHIVDFVLKSNDSIFENGFD